MNKRRTLENLEAEIGRSLTEAFPTVQAPPEVVERIRRRLPTGSPVRRTGLARILPFPPRNAPHPAHRPALRWLAAAVAAVLLTTAGGPRLERTARRWFGPQSSFPIAAPFPLSGVALAASPAPPALPQQFDFGVRYRLEAPLPALPATGVIQSVQVPNEAAWLEPVRKGLGITDPIKAEWDKLPLLTPKTGHRAGPLVLSLTGAWWYDANWRPNPVAANPPGTEPQAEPAFPPTELGLARTLAEAWLKQGNLYPSGPLEVTAEQSQWGMAVIAFYPATGSPLAAAGDYPGIRVGVRNGRVETAGGVWPERVADLADVPLRSIEEAWADLQAGIGVINPDRPAMAVVGPNPVMTIREVRLDRALVRSLDDRWYYIPVVLFRGEITGADGKPHEQLYYVSAIKPQPGQGGYELKADLPESPGDTPALRVVKPTQETVTWKSYRPEPQPETFKLPSDANVFEAARRIINSSEFADLELGKPELIRGVADITAIFPIQSAGLPIIRTDGTPSFARQVSVGFRLPDSVQHLSLFSFPAEPAGDPLPLLTAEEAWKRVGEGAGRVKIINSHLEFTNAHFAAHRTVIDRVTLAYEMDQSVQMGKEIIEPAWFFYGTAEVGEEHREVEVVVIIPARK